MEIQVVTGGIQSTEDELIVVNLFEGLEKPGDEEGKGAFHHLMLVLN